KPAAGLIATYCSPIVFNTSAMKSDPGRVIKLSLGSFFSAGGLAAASVLSPGSAAWASLVVAAIAAPAAAAVPLRNERRPVLLLSGMSFMPASWIARNGNRCLRHYSPVKHREQATVNWER